MSNDFHVYEDAGRVVIHCGGQAVELEPDEARSVAAAWAQQAQYGRTLNLPVVPAPVQLPAAWRLNPAEATAAAWELFSTACQLELMVDVRYQLAADPVDMVLDGKRVRLART